MFNSNNGIPFMMNVEPANSNDGGWGGNGGWFMWFIIIILLCFGWGNGYGYGGGGSGQIGDNYVLASDFATLQRQLSDGFAATERKGDIINAGLCDGFYAQNTTMLNGFNGVNAAITQTQIAAMQNQNALSAQLAQCCCDNKAATKDLQYALATQSCATNNNITTGFGNLKYDMAAQDCAIKQTVNDVGRGLADVQNANTQAILAKLDAMENSRKDEKIATLQAQVSDMKLIANNNAQTTVFTNALAQAVQELSPKPPVAAFTVPAPWQYGGCGCNCNC